MVSDLQKTHGKSGFTALLVAMICVVVHLAATKTARADTVSTPSPELSVHIADATLVGRGVLKIYWAKVYLLSHYIKDTDNDGKPDTIILHYDYLRDVPKYATIDASRDEFIRYPHITDEKLTTWMDYLDKALTDMKTDDQAIIVRQADESIHFYMENAQPVIITDAEFSQMFLDIWLGAETNYPTLRKQLLALN
jgi:hypothetical protein